MGKLSTKMAAIAGTKTPEHTLEELKDYHRVGEHRNMVVYHKKFVNKYAGKKSKKLSHEFHVGQMDKHAKAADGIQSKYKASKWAAIGKHLGKGK